MSEATELIELPPAETALQVYQRTSGLDPWLQRIREQVTGIVADVSTRKGREEIASRAFKVRKSKTALDALGKKLVDEMKDVPKKIDSERKRMRDALDALADEVRRPLTEWEEAEAQRVAEHKANVECLQAVSTEGMAAKDIQALLTCLESSVIDGSWEEFEAEAHRVKAASVDTYRTALAARERYEAEQAELARLRAEAETRARRDEEERIAREAAERATREAEARAQAERDAAARREQEAKAAAERRELELKLAAEKAQREKLAAQQRAEQAERDAKAKADAAAAAERQRQADEAARLERERLAREANEAHCRAINRAALKAMLDGGLPEDCAKLAIKLIANGRIPNINISY